MNLNKYIYIVIFWLSGCGVTFSSGYSYYDEMYFQKSPWIEKEGEKYYLKWVYGKYGFYYQPQCIARAEEALCSLQGTSSSGVLTGREGYIQISNSAVIAAIENNQIYWLEPNNEKVRLKVK